MTEAEWLACTEPAIMLGSLEGQASDRKLRLLAVACCRRTWHLLPDARVRGAIEVAERFADGLATAQEWQASWATAHAAARDADDAYGATGSAAIGDADAEEGRRAAAWAAIVGRAATHAARNAFDSTASFAAKTASAAASHAAEYAAAAAANTTEYAFRAKARGDERAEHCRLLRCVVGNPFRPVALNPAWLTPDVLALAQAASEERQLPEGALDPDRLRLLADALEDAGCTNADILGHLRGPGPHVRGCWAVDLVLGKS
jgi:hypothetical protein